jgi:hypothetical protein
MKKLIIIITFFFSLPVVLFTGCVTVEETLYLRQAEVTGPIVTSPIHITDSTDTPSITFSPKFTYNTKNLFTGHVAQNTSYDELDSVLIPLENSLTWDIATFNAGLDIDIALSQVFAISMGVNYSSQNNFSAFGGNFGIGFFGYNKGSAFRFDMGLQIHSMRYDAYTVVVTRESSYGATEEYVNFFHDVGESTYFNPYFNFTYNTAFKNWPLNLFINAGYSFQTLFSFEPRTSYHAFGHYTQTDKRGSSTAGFINVTPGIYFTFAESMRILLGTRFYIETQIEGAEPTLFIFPMMQFDFRL